MSLLRRSRFQPTRKLTRRRKLLNLVRNVWVLRGELWAIIRHKPVEPAAAPIALRCIACRHELTKPCIRGRTKHVVRWPAGAPGFEPGTLVEVRRQKLRGDGYDQDFDLTALT